MSRYGDEPVHARRQREDRRKVALLLNVVAVRAAADSGVQLMPAASPALPRQRAPRPKDAIPKQRTTPPED